MLIVISPTKKFQEIESEEVKILMKSQRRKKEKERAQQERIVSNQYHASCPENKKNYSINNVGRTSEGQSG